MGDAPPAFPFAFPPARSPGVPLLLGALLSLALAGCHSPTSRSTPKSRVPTASSSAALPPTSPSTRPDTRLGDATVDRLAESHAAFAEGLVRQMRDDSAGMLEYWTRAYAADPDNEALALEVARRRITRKEFQAALAVLERAAARPAQTPEIFSLLGLTRMQLGQGPEALEAYRTALKMQPDNPGAYAAFARLLLDQGHLPEALSMLDEGMSRNPTDPGLILQFAETLRLLGTKDPQQVEPTRVRLLSWLDRAAALDPSDANVLLRLAELNKGVGRNAEAEQLFKASKTRAPRNPFASARLAEMYLRDGKLAEAREQLESLQRDEPTNPVPWYYLGVLAMDRRDYARAEELFSRSLALDSNQEPALLDLAAAQFSQDRTDESLATLSRVREKFAPSFRAEYLTALAHGRKKEHVAARNSFLAAERVAATNNPALIDARLHFQIGLTCSELPGHRPEAEERLQKALSLDPAFDEAQNALGYLWAEQGVKLEEAQRLIEAAVKAEPDNPAYLDSLGWVLYKRGDAAGALKPIERAVELMRRTPDATLLDHLADIYAALKRWPEARATWEQALKLEPNPAIQRKLADAATK